MFDENFVEGDCYYMRFWKTLQMHFFVELDYQAFSIKLQDVEVHLQFPKFMLFSEGRSWMLVKALRKFKLSNEEWRYRNLELVMLQ